jgi:acetyltransferase-like isoleucine patch superfamily enzyme
MRIGKSTSLSKIDVTWPHQVLIGKKCVFEKGIYFKYDGIWQKGPSIIIGDEVFIGKGCEFNINCKIVIDNYVNIASGCKFIDHDHGIVADKRIGPQQSVKAAIIINEDAWLGVNVIVLKGVLIGKGAVIAAGAVVTRSVPAYEIWGGIPARKIGQRTGN